MQPRLGGGMQKKAAANDLPVPLKTKQEDAESFAAGKDGNGPHS